MKFLDSLGLFLTSMSIIAIAGCLMPSDTTDLQDQNDSPFAEYALPQESPIGVTHGEIVFDSLSQWQRHPKNPVFRDPMPGYEVAADPHVFHDQSGALWVIYTGDHEGHASIKMGKGNAYDIWSKVTTVLPGSSIPSGDDPGKETAFYRYEIETEKHQIYYIAYPDGDTDDGYESSIYLAEADEIEGPYTMSDTPIIERGHLADEDVYLMTSPSVVEYDGELYLSFLAWDNAPNKVTAVWVMGAVSDDQGANWGAFRKIEAPIGMEGQITKGPDGLFYAVSSQDHGATRAIFLSRSARPFESYTALTEPILIRTDAGLEKHEANAPQLTFNPISRRAYLYYHGADYASGYWMMVAQTPYTTIDD